MTFVVPFDGSPLATAALSRAAELGTALDESVLAVTVVPENNTDYARERDWLDDAEFEMEAVVENLESRVVSIAPDVQFRHEVVDRYAPSGTISKAVRSVAREVDATMVFLGSENAGRLVTSLSSVADGVAADAAYDVVIVRHERPATGSDATDQGSDGPS